MGFNHQQRVGCEGGKHPIPLLDEMILESDPGKGNFMPVETWQVCPGSGHDGI